MLKNRVKRNSRKDFLEKIMKEHESLEKKKSIRRRKIVELALSVVYETDDISVFSSKLNTVDTIKNNKTKYSIDNDKLNEVSTFLHNLYCNSSFDYIISVDNIETPYKQKYSGITRAQPKKQ